jgi:hypothetical protein
LLPTKLSFLPSCLPCLPNPPGNKRLSGTSSRCMKENAWVWQPKRYVTAVVKVM